ncbi:MAG: glutamine synthetase type III, partial [Oscillospiraceae bacterium]
MIGSSASIASINYMINTAVSKALDEFADRLEVASNVKKEVYSIVADTYKAHKRIIFNGNNYSSDWVEQARERGLNNITNTVDAIDCLINEKNINLFEKYGVFTKSECYSRYDIFHETYTKTISIEASTMLEMSKCQIIPKCMEYLGKISKDYNSLCKSGVKNKSTLA